MKRKIEPHPAIVIADKPGAMDDVQDWLQAQAVQRKLKWLLAHADDGVIWGKLDDQNRLVTSYEVAQGNPEAEKACPALRAETLQQARLFAEHAELLLWRDGEGEWCYRVIQDIADPAPTLRDAFDEPQMMWGTHGAPLPQGFTLLSDGAQGLRHAIPLKRLDQPGETQPPRLMVRHYLGQEDFAQVVVSRLVGFAEEEQQ